MEEMPDRPVGGCAELRKHDTEEEYFSPHTVGFGMRGQPLQFRYTIVVTASGTVRLDMVHTPIGPFQLLKSTYGIHTDMYIEHL